jgi:hypothetical protein
VIGWRHRPVRAGVGQIPGHATPACMDPTGVSGRSW